MKTCEIANISNCDECALHVAPTAAHHGNSQLWRRIEFELETLHGNRGRRGANQRRLVLMLLSVQMFGNQCLMNSSLDQNIWLALIENGLGLPKALKHHLLEE